MRSGVPHSPLAALACNRISGLVEQEAVASATLTLPLGRASEGNVHTSDGDPPGSCSAGGSSRALLANFG